MNKKASMSLGVNSIVVLIIAVIVLGLVIGFINQTFKKIEKNIEPPKCNPPTPNALELVTLCPETIHASPGETVSLNVMIFNNKENKLDIGGNNSNMVLEIVCSDDITTDPIKYLSKEIPSHEARKMPVIFTISSSAGKSIYPCSLQVKDGNSIYGEADFDINIG